MTQTKHNLLFRNYLEQSKDLRPLGIKKPKGSLALITTLAASALIGADLQAQCGAGNFDPSGGYYSDGQLDVNGDGVPDFDFDVVCYETSGGSVTSFYLYMTVVGTMNFGAPLLAAGDKITTADASITSSFSLLIGSYPTVATQTFYIAISDDAGNVGFVEITVDPSLGCPAFTINLANSGIEDGSEAAADIGCADAGDCATLVGVVPVTLVGFNLESRQDGNYLSWETATEINNKGFEIQKSMDGSDFERIGWIDGEGNSTTNLDYDFEDKNVQPNVEYYYRLKQTDYNGNFAFSDVIIGRYDDSNATRISNITPNPVNGFANIDVFVNDNSSAIVNIYSNSGQLISSETPALIKGENALKVNSQNLQPGVYYVKVTIGDEVSYQKLLVL